MNSLVRVMALSVLLLGAGGSDARAQQLASELERVRAELMSARASLAASHARHARLEAQLTLARAKADQAILLRRNAERELVTLRSALAGEKVNDYAIARYGEHANPSAHRTAPQDAH